MPGTDVRLGPFTNGMNTLSDPTALQDTELVDSVNLELDVDGSFASRPPILELSATPPSSTSRILALGWVVIGGNSYLIGSSGQGVYYFASGSWTLITNTITSIAMAQYDNSAWIVAAPGSTGTSGYWNPTEDWVTGGATGTTKTGNMPRGNAIAVNKDRIFIGGVPDASGNSTALVNFSVPNAGLGIAITWPAGTTHEFYANRGDGERVVDLIVYNNSVMIFKRNSTYVFAYDTDPSLGILDTVNKAIGATRSNCVVLHENNLYVFHEGFVYEVLNQDFNRLNTKVPFLFDPTAPGLFADEVFMSIIGDRLVVRYFNRIYVFGFNTRVWTRWETAKYFGPLFRQPVITSTTVMAVYIGGSCILDIEDKYYQFTDGFDGSSSETITCKIRTKNYDMSVPQKFKRLFNWGVEVSTVNPVTGILEPIIFNFSVTWGQLALKKWGELNTWGQPLAVPQVIETLQVTGSGAFRRYVKFKKSIRFRQVAFEVELTNDGTITTAPCRLFVITCGVATKEKVVKAIS